MRIPLTLLALALLTGCGATTSSTTPAPAQSTTTPTTAAPQSAPTSAPAATASAGSTSAPETALKLISDAFNRPVYVTHAGDDSGRLFVVEKAGRIVILRDGQPAAKPFLDISDRVGSDGSEQGLLSVAFHPQFRENGRLFVD